MFGLVCREKRVLYVPVVLPQTYSNREQVKIFMTKLESSKTQILWQPTLHYESDNVGEKITGDSIGNSFYQLEMKVSEVCESVCRKELSDDEVKQFSKVIAKEYRVHWIFYNLAAMIVLSGPSFDQTDVSYQCGYPLGFTEEVLVIAFLSVFLLLRALWINFGGFFFHSFPATNVLLGGNDYRSPPKLGPYFSRMKSLSLNDKLVGGGPSQDWFSAIKSGDEESIKNLLTNNPTLLHLKDNNDYGATALHKTVRYGDEAVARLLLEHNADPSALTEGKFTPLHLAAYKGHKAVARLLLEHCADPETLTEGKYTPLHLAALSGYEAVAAVLLVHHADPNALTKDKWTPLHNAALNGREAVARLLLENHADPNALTKDMWTPLHYARTDAMRMLLQKVFEEEERRKEEEEKARQKAIEEEERRKEEEEKARQKAIEEEERRKEEEEEARQKKQMITQKKIQEKEGDIEDTNRVAEVQGPTQTKSDAISTSVKDHNVSKLTDFRQVVDTNRVVYTEDTKRVSEVDRPGRCCCTS